MQAVRDKVAIESPEGNLWVGVIEQAVFDAHLHSTGGKYPSVAYVKEARGYFDTPEFEHVCMMLGIESAWVRSMVEQLRLLAIIMRGTEYDAAAISVADEERTRNHERRNSNGRADCDKTPGKGDG